MNCALTVIFSAILFSCNAVQLPSYFPKCSLSDPNLGDCIRDSGNEGLSTFIQGDKKIHIVELNPLHVNSMFIDVNGMMKINLTDFKIFGMDTTRITAQRWDAENKRAEAEVHIDYTSLIGEYEVSGQILILPINGQGPCNITFVRPLFKYNFDFELEDRKGKEYVKIINPSLTYETERAYFKLNNLFGGNAQLAETMLQFLDENWKEVNQEIGTRVGDALALVFSEILQNMFYRIPYSELFNP